MLENIKNALGKLMGATKEKAEIDAFAGIIKEVDDCEAKISQKSKDYEELQSKYCDIVLHCPSSNESAGNENSHTPRTVEEITNDIIANRK